MVQQTYHEQFCFRAIKAEAFWLAEKEEILGFELEQLTKKSSEDPRATRKRTPACAAVVSVLLEM